MEEGETDKAHYKREIILVLVKEAIRYIVDFPRKYNRPVWSDAILIS